MDKVYNLISQGIDVIEEEEDSGSDSCPSEGLNNDEDFCQMVITAITPKPPQPIIKQK